MFSLFRSDVEPVDAGYCHCRICQRSTGAPVLAWASYPVGSFVYTRGAPAVYQSSGHGHREFCHDCGTQIAYRDSENAKTVEVNVGSLDDCGKVLPRYHIWCGSRIPWFDTADAGRPASLREADRSRLFGLLRGFPRVLLLSGHRHTQQHVFHDAASGWHGAGPLHEYNVGAASGAYWSGAADAAGIPDATMADGTPNGHATLLVRSGGDYALAWHPARVGDGGDATTAMGLHAPRVLRRGAYPAWGVYANVYMGLEDTRVEFRVGQGEWRPMRKVEAPDPRLVVENVRDDLATELRGFDRSPEAVPSTHLWRGALPTDLEVGEHTIQVRALDRWQGEQRASTRYRLIEATP